MILNATTQQSPAPDVLVVLSSNEYRIPLLQAVADAGMVPMLCESLEAVREAMTSENVRAVICEDLFPEPDLTEILKKTQNRTRPVPVILTSRTGEWDEFLTALRQGAFDYLVLPPRRDEVKRVLGLAMAEGSRTETDRPESGEALIADGKPLAYRFDDNWGVIFSDTAPAFSRPLS